MRAPLNPAKSLDYLIKEQQPLESLIKRQTFVWKEREKKTCLLGLSPLKTGTALAHTRVSNDKSAERAGTVLEPATTVTFPQGQR